MKKISGIKYKVSPKGCEYKSRSKAKLPLIGKTIYLDVKDSKQIKKLKHDLKRLGATLEEFASCDINYLITCQLLPKPGRPSDPFQYGDGSPTYSPFNCEHSPSPGCTDEKKLSATRGRALLEKAKVTKQASSLLENAQKWGVKIVSLEGAVKWINRELKKLPTLQPNTKKSSKCISSYQNLSGRLIKCEVESCVYRPFYQELNQWPHINLDTPRGSCPFDGSIIKCGDESQEERGELLAAQVDVPSEDDTPGNDMDNIDSQNKRLDVEGAGRVQMLTAGELRRRREQKHHQDRKKGYCECCRLKYDNLDRHVQEECHRLYVKDKTNYAALDNMITSGPSSCTFLHNILTHAAIQRKASTRLKSPVKLTQTASRFTRRKLHPIPNSRPPRETDRDHLVVESAAPEKKAWSSPRKLNQQKPAMKASSPKLPKQSSQDVPGYLESVKSSVESPVCVSNSLKKPVTNLTKEIFISPVKLIEDTSFSRKNSIVGVNFCKPSNLFSVNGNISSNDCDKAHAEQCLQRIQGENNNATEIALEGKQNETLVVFDHETKKRTSVSSKSKKTSAQFLTLSEPVNEKLNINDSLSKDLRDLKTVPEWLLDISDSESSRNVTRNTEKCTTNGRAFANVANADEHDDQINHDQNQKHTECEKSYVPKVSTAKKNSLVKWKSKVKSDNCDLVSKKESKQNGEGKFCRYIVEKGSDNSDDADMPKELKKLICSTSQILTCNESPRKSKLEASKSIHYAFESCGSCIPRSGAGRQGSDYAGGDEKIKEREIIQRCFSELLKHTRQLELSTDDFEDCFAKEWKDHELPGGENVGRMTQSVSNTSSEFELYKDYNPFYVNNISNKKNLVQTKDKLSSDIISLNTDMPSDFQVLGGDGEVLHFTKTLAERIKERGRRSVSTCNVTCTRTRPTDSCSVKQNTSKKNKLVPHKTVASVASAKVLNKYRLHRHTGLTDNVHQSGYQGDDEKETTPKVNTLRALREKISKKNKSSERARQSDRSVPYEPSCLKNNVLVTLETDGVKEAKGKNPSWKKESAFRKCVAGKARDKITLENDRKKITIEKKERRRGVKIKHKFWDYVAVDKGKNPDKNVTMKNHAKELRLLQDSSLLSSDFSDKECYTQKLKRKCNSQLNKGMKPLVNIETAMDTITKLNQNEEKKVNVETANDIVNNEKNPRRGKFWTYEIITDDSDVEESVELIPRQLKNLKCLWNNFSNSESERRCRSRERSMRDGWVIRTVNNCAERKVRSLNSYSSLESENKKRSGSRKRKVNWTSEVVQDEKLEDELDLPLPREVRKLKLDKALIARKSRSLRSCGHSPEIHCNKVRSNSLHRDKGRDVVLKTNVQYKQRSNEHAIVETKQSPSKPLRKDTVNAKTKTLGNARSPSPVFKSSSQNFKPIRRKSPVFNHSLISGKTKQCKISRICSHRSAQEDDKKITATISNENSGRTTPNKSIDETPKSPPSSHSRTLRAERIQWKRKQLESKPESAESQQKKMKLCNEETAHFPVKTSVVRSPRKNLESLNKENKKAFLVSKENSNECKPFALHWSSIKRKDNGTSELEVIERVKINKMWTVLSERSASRLLSSEADRETFEGLGGMEESLQSGLSFQNCSKQQIPVSDTHQWEIEDEEQEQESVANLVKFVPLVSSPWKHSNSSWDEACDSMIDKSLKHSPNSSLKCLNSSTNYNFSSPKKTFLSPAKKLNSPVSKRPNTPNKRNPVHSSCIRHVDGEIEFNFGSPHKYHVAFSPLKSVNGAVVDCSKRPVLAALDSTPTHVDRRTRHQKENT